MGLWYAQLGRGDGASVVDDTPWVPRGHGRETTFQQNLVERAQIEEAARDLLDQVLDDVSADGRPVVGPRAQGALRAVLHEDLHEEDRRRPSTARSCSRRRWSWSSKIEPDRPIRLLGVRAEMAMPDDAREGHSPTRSGW